MSNNILQLTPDLHQYMVSVTGSEPQILQRLRQETARLSQAGMQISVEQGRFMALLIGLMGARKTLEVGVFTGYSSLAVALALPPDGQIIACDVSEEWTTIARRYWQEAGVAEKIDLRLAPAVQTLEQLVASGQTASFDFAFIDADKTGYDQYYEYALRLVRPGGLIAIDNVLWSGRIIDPAANDADTLALRQLNNKLHRDERVTLSMLPIGDGLTLALKR